MRFGRFLPKGSRTTTCQDEDQSPHLAATDNILDQELENHTQNVCLTYKEPRRGSRNIDLISRLQNLNEAFQKLSL